MKPQKFLLILFLILFLVFLSEIIYPSYLSYKYACVSPELISNETISGSFDPSTCIITIYEEPNSKEYFRTLKHENCHMKIFMAGNHFECDEPTKVILEEVRCYLSEYF